MRCDCEALYRDHSSLRCPLLLDATLATSRTGVLTGGAILERLLPEILLFQPFEVSRIKLGVLPFTERILRGVPIGSIVENRGDGESASGSDAPIVKSARFAV